MSITVGASEISCAYIGSTPLKEIYVGTTKVRPTIKNACIEWLLVGGGGAGGPAYGVFGGGGGGAGGVIYCSSMELSQGTSYCVVIGNRGNRGSITYSCARNGGDSCFGSIVAYGGGGGGRGASNCACSVGYTGGSGGGSSGCICNGCYALGCSGQGNNGGPWNLSGSYVCKGFGGAGGGGKGSAGCVNNYTVCDPVCNQAICPTGGNGGNGYTSSISGTSVTYAAGGGGGGGFCKYNTRCICGNGGTSQGGGTGAKAGYSGCCCGCNATTYGSGGGGGGGICCGIGGRGGLGGYGNKGVFIARYPTVCGYDITGGTKYTCGTYTIHCFTSNGTLTVN